MYKTLVRFKIQLRNAYCFLAAQETSNTQGKKKEERRTYTELNNAFILAKIYLTNQTQ